MAATTAHAPINEDARWEPDEVRDAAGAAVGGRRVLACASPGGHFTQLVTLVRRIPDVASITWVTPERRTSRGLLAEYGHGEDSYLAVHDAAPRDVPNLARNAGSVAALLARHRFDLALSTGAGIAVASLPLARARGIRSVYIESATRDREPSVSGRILTHVPGIELCSQNRPFDRRWRSVGSVHDNFRPGPTHPPRIQRLVVTTGTIRAYGFRRLLDRMVEVLPSDVEVLWQTGMTDLTGLDITGHRTVPPDRFHQALRDADLVVAHAGSGTALTCFSMGISPLLVPRRHGHGEHVDDHQVPTAKALSDKGLATYLEVGDIDLDALCEASTHSVVVRRDPPPLDL